MGRHAGVPHRGTIERANDMAARFRAGQTYAEIADVYGMSRQAVDQLLTRYHGISATDGGQAVKAARRAARRHMRLELRCLANKGMSLAEYRTFKASEPKACRAYKSQKNNANRRGIGWELTLRQWWMIWQASGRWHQRGLRRGQYVMCRYGDVGAYAINNVFIATSSENISAANRKSNRHLPVGVYLRPANIYCPYVAKRVVRGKTLYLGAHPTPEDAHRAYLEAA